MVIPARVATKALMRAKATRAPFHMPQDRATASMMRIPAASPKAFIAMMPTTPASAITEPTERSKPPEIMTNVIPAA